MSLAIKICEALGKPVPNVFPGAGKLLDAYHGIPNPNDKEARDIAVKLRAIGIETDICRHVVKLILRGHRDPIFLDVSSGDVDRVIHVIQKEETTEPETAFVVFDSDEDRIAINLRFASFCQFLDEIDLRVLDPTPQVESESEPSNVVRVYLGENPIPVELSVNPEDDDEDDDPGDVNGAIYDLDSSGLLENQRIRICDDDGDCAFFRAGDIAILTAPLWVLDPDERIYDDDMDEDDEGAAPLPAEGGAGHPPGAHPGALS
ncbi:hypothetical protein BN2497_4189 [Janthinobacterium sp. CG23_2]|nr:hypothetical protein BN2497_4189 [Janthinobacterium sp. CG23_2]CUU28492.1 hypothetical protein BN3177_4189 [Janthinobacterium sp. CG23_2]